MGLSFRSRWRLARRALRQRFCAHPALQVVGERIAESDYMAVHVLTLRCERCERLWIVHRKAIAKPRPKTPRPPADLAAARGSR